MFYALRKFEDRSSLKRKRDSGSGRRKKSSGLVHKTSNVPPDESARRKIATCTPKDWKEQRMAEVQQLDVQSSSPPVNFLWCTEPPAAFPILLQHIPANNCGQAYNELTWQLIEMID